MAYIPGLILERAEGPQHPKSPVRYVHDRAKVGPTSLRWGDPVWDSVVSPVLDALQVDLDGTARGGRVLGLVVKAWKEGVAIGSNKEVGATLHSDLLTRVKSI